MSAMRRFDGYPATRRSARSRIRARRATKRCAIRRPLARVDELLYRAERRLRCDAFQAVLQNPQQEGLVAWALAQWKAGDLTLDDAQHIVTNVRQQAREAA